ncbi:hypothetical protein M0811_02040 [Anaeramoeba ignava]|uniref:Uncharacterized protein n=1 Tax=Anaeramoeba ignava TaxID=1746090 RepID=A0A9Q0LE60_ANAIG|nr:hypothetical protein M0811_02040 [Anaeramoeba ignava]
MDDRLVIVGPTLASLFYDISRSESDIKGLFFGKLKESIIVSIEDTHEEHERIVTTTVIQSFVVLEEKQMDKKMMIENSKLNKEMINEIIQKRQRNQQSLLGWFAFRRNTPLRPSVKEIYIHREMNNFFQEKKMKFSPIFAVMNEYLSSTYATDFFDYRFFKFDFSSENYFPIKLEIINLKDTTSEEYSQFSSSIPSVGLSQNHSYNKIAQKFSKNGLDSFIQSVPPDFTKNIENFFDETSKKMNELVNQYDLKVAQIEEIEKQINLLKQN